MKDVELLQLISNALVRATLRDGLTIEAGNALLAASVEILNSASDIAQREHDSLRDFIVANRASP